jgi:glycosyltransferase involved in cell wall biosynthesis
MVTVHDLNHLQFGSRMQKAYYQYLLKPFVRRAAIAATVSNFSRKEIASWAGLAESSIEVVPNALDPVFLERVAPSEVDAVVSKFGLEKKRYFFCLSNAKPHKNVALLVKAYQKAEPSTGWSLAVNLLPEELALPASPGVKYLGPLLSEDARALMAGSGAVVFPSLYEGFGLPPVEAACMGAPLVVSRIAPHREALADLEQGEVLWVDPMDEAAWTKALLRASEGQVLGTSLESRSKLMRRYSVARLGADMDRLYRRMLNLVPGGAAK